MAAAAASRPYAARFDPAGGSRRPAVQSFKTTRPRAAQRVGLRGASPHALVLRGVADGGRWQIACGPSDSERWPNGGPKSALFDGVSAARRRLNGKGNLGGGSVRGTGPSDHLRRTDSEMRRTGMPLKQVLSLKFFYSFSSRPQAPAVQRPLPPPRTLAPSCGLC